MDAIDLIDQQAQLLNDLADGQALEQAIQGATATEQPTVVSAANSAD